jgi:hypothetical protein
LSIPEANGSLEKNSEIRIIEEFGGRNYEKTGNLREVAGAG